MNSAAAAILAGAVMLSACSGGGTKPVISPATSTPVLPTTSSVPLPGLTTSAPATVTTTGPLGSTTIPPTSRVVDGRGAFLVAPPPPVTQSTAPPGADCHALVDAGWTVSACGSPAGPGRAWLVERKPVGSAVAWRVFVTHFSQGKGVWLVDLDYSDGSGNAVASIKVLTAVLTPDNAPSLLVGVRNQGSGALLAYDVVTGLSAASGPRVAVHRELSHGQATVHGKSITDVSAQYPGGEPNCCPAYFARTTITSPDGIRWLATPAGSSPTNGAGDF